MRLENKIAVNKKSNYSSLEDFQELLINVCEGNDLFIDFEVNTKMLDKEILLLKEKLFKQESLIEKSNDIKDTLIRKISVLDELVRNSIEQQQRELGDS